MATTSRSPEPSAPSLGEEPGQWVATRDAPVGGQAVLEGVMMRGVRNWAVAVRTPAPDQLDEEGARIDAADPPTGEIATQTFPIESVLKRHRLLRLPIVRGVVALGESLMIGFKALGISANAQMPEEEEPISGFLWGGDDRLRALAVRRPLLHRPGDARRTSSRTSSARRCCSGSSRGSCER